MRETGFKLLLLVGCLVQLAVLGARVGGEFAISDGLLVPPHGVLGDDFINLYSTAKLVLAGASEDIYQPTTFMAFQRTLIPAHIGLRLWAYPPHTLLMVPPFGLPDYFVALALWSILGLVVLAWGARRMGFDALETAIILLSPAALSCIYYGQTGNLAAGLMLLALSARRDGDPLSVGAAALLTVKPQMGFLLPLVWAVRRQWRLIALTTVLVLALAGASLALFGLEAWRDYVGETLTTLDGLERHGSGPFMTMIPSAFMAFRILTGDGDLAASLHLVFALAVGAFVVWRLTRTPEQTVQNALVLIGTTLLTPYIHNYDLALLLCGALLLLRRRHHLPLLAYALVVLAWSLPSTVVVFNALGVPVSPLILLALLWLATRGPPHAEAVKQT